MTLNPTVVLPLGRVTLNLNSTVALTLVSEGCEGDIEPNGGVDFKFEGDILLFLGINKKKFY